MGKRVESQQLELMRLSSEVISLRERNNDEIDGFEDKGLERHSDAQDDEVEAEDHSSFETPDLQDIQVSVEMPRMSL
jgi:hypothetical protein